ncbi:hypothetical protein E4U41_003743 [Claviceps citrina]|nr:hypothetical protein E4U41_003743 [Claviceps citrina]
MDMVLGRELSLSAKTKTRPDGSSARPPTDMEMHDELFMLLIAGHETTATTLCWCVKLLTNHPASQARLRASLRTALAAHDSNRESREKDAHRENDAPHHVHPAHPPTLHALLDADVPYLDATLEECVRLANIVPRIVRVALQDTQILGRHVPRGAQVMCTTSVCRRSLGRETGHDKHEDEDMDAFLPERWLDEAGAFDPQAVPRMAFSGGPRVCFGKRFAMQELRIILAVLVLNFRFGSLPPDLNSMRSDPGALRTPRQTFVRLEAEDGMLDVTAQV